MAITSDATPSSLSVPYAADATPRSVRLKRWLAALGLLLLAALVAGAWAVNRNGNWLRPASSSPLVFEVRPTDMALTLIEQGELTPRKSIEIKCEVEGQSTIKYVVTESTRVKKGDLLLELASEVLADRIESEEIELQKVRTALEAAEHELAITQNENASKIKKAEIDLQVARLDLQQYLEGEYQKALKGAEIDIAQTTQEIARKEDDLRKNRDLHERGFVTESKINDIEFELEKLRMTLEKNLLARQILEQYDLVKNRTQKSAAVEQAGQELARELKRSESRERQAAAKVQEQRSIFTMLEGRLARLRTQLERCRIVAPVDGIVQYPSSNDRWDAARIAQGEKVNEGQTVLVLPDTGQMVVKTRIHEADRHRVHEGLACRVTVPAVPGRVFPGKLAKIAKFADSANRWLNPELKEHTAEILLDETDAPVSPGDSADVEIVIDYLPEVLAVPVQAIFSRGNRSFVFLANGDPREVQIGRSNLTLVEIGSGLSAGDQILLQASDDLVAKLPEPPAGEPTVAEGTPAASEKRPAPAGPRNRPAGSARRG